MSDGQRRRRPGARVLVRDRGASVAELLVIAAIAGVLASWIAPLLLARLDALRARSAARHLAALLLQARVRALVAGVSTAVIFTPVADGYELSLVEDGDDDGVRTADVREGIDRVVGAPTRIESLFRGVRFGLAADVTGPDGTERLAAGSDPIRFGRASLAAFTPVGTSSSGTAYVQGADGTQLAVRLLGATGRCRTLEHVAGVWEPR